MDTFRRQLTGQAAWRARQEVGTALYRERVLPPPDSRVEAILEDISFVDAPATKLAMVELAGRSGPPYGFVLETGPKPSYPSWP